MKTKTPKVETHRYPARTDRHYRRLFSVIRAYLDDLDAGRFVFRPGFGCSTVQLQGQPLLSMGRLAARWALLIIESSLLESKA